MLNLDAKTREVTGSKVKTLREQGVVPAVVYGHGLANQNVQLDYTTFKKLFDEAGESSLIELKVDKKEPIVVLVQDIQYDPVTDRIQHVDFHQIKKGEKIHTEIELKFVGEPKAVKELGGILVKPYDKLEIKCLPKDLVHQIEVDVSQLATFDDVIRIKDLNIPEGIEVLSDPQGTIALVAQPKKEEVVEKVVEAAAPAEAKVGEEKKEEEEEKS